LLSIDTFIKFIFVRKWKDNLISVVFADGGWLEEISTINIDAGKSENKSL
jgi:hypothetical protein